MLPIKLIVRATVVATLLVLTPVALGEDGLVRDNLACSKDKEPDCVREIAAQLPLLDSTHDIGLGILWVNHALKAGSRPVINYYQKEEGK